MDNFVLQAATISNGGSALALPAATVPVVSTFGFPAAGTFLLPSGATVTYTGKTSTSFTGDTGGAGTVTDGTVINSGDAFKVNTTGTSTAAVTLEYQARAYND